MRWERITIGNDSRIADARHNGATMKLV